MVCFQDSAFKAAAWPRLLGVGVRGSDPHREQGWGEHMSSTHCKAKAKNRAGGRCPPLIPRTWLAEAQDTDQAGWGWGLWPSLEQQQQDSVHVCVGRGAC